MILFKTRRTAKSYSTNIFFLIDFCSGQILSEILKYHRRKRDVVRGQNVNYFDTLSKKVQRSTTGNNRAKI